MQTVCLHSTALCKLKVCLQIGASCRPVCTVGTVWSLHRILLVAERFAMKLPCNNLDNSISSHDHGRLHYRFERAGMGPRIHLPS